MSSHSILDSPPKVDNFEGSLMRFKYQPLNSEQNEIRLLRIEPDSNPYSTIRCELFSTSLANAPPYEALSYAWGDRTSSHEILINSNYLRVTPNLQYALQRLRPKVGDPELIIWVDALCINQEDIPERSIQTSKMRMIYQNAEKVSIWLGLENNGSTLAVDLARDFNHASKEEVSGMIQDPTRAEQFSALVVLFRRQYWWRIWVIQEVSCARTAMVYCGEDSIPWTDLDNVADILRAQEEHLRMLYYKNLSHVRTLTHGGPRGLRLSRYSLNASTPPLLELLLSHKSKKSTDSRDKVYALVGISDTRDSFGKIDYSLSRREVFTHTTRHIISSSQKLDVICVKQHDMNQRTMPSWAPDWTRPPANSGHMVVGLHHREPTFSAAGGSLAQCSFLDDGYVLKATGFVVDRIKAVGSAFKKRGSPSEVLPSLHAFEDWWNIFISFMGESVSAQSMFARVISCGNWIFDNDQAYQERLMAIFTLSKSNVVRFSPDAEPREEMESSLELEKVETDEDKKDQMASILSAGLMMNRRRLFISSNNAAGLAPWNAEPEDMICILLGCRFPIVLRRLGESWPYHYELIGEAYVDGMMNGEAMEELKDEMFVLEDFEIH